MTDILVTSPFQPFTLPTQFKAVFNGYIYCGTVDAVDPSVSQVQVYLVNESGDKVPVAQPLRTNAGGFLVYNGQPAKFVTDSNHSLLVQDSFHSQVWYAPDMASIDPEAAIDEVFEKLGQPDGASLVGGAFYADIRSYAGTMSRIDCLGRTNVFDGGYGAFYRDASDTTSQDNDFNILVGVGGVRWKRRSLDREAAWSGVNGASSDVSSAMLKAISGGGEVKIADGQYNLLTVVKTDFTGATYPAIGRKSSRYDLVGASKHNTVFNTNGNDAFHSVGNTYVDSSQRGQGIYTGMTWRDFAVYGTDMTGKGLILEGQIFANVKDVLFRKLDTALELKGAIVSDFDNVNVEFCKKGMTLAPAPNSPINSVNFGRMKFGSCWEYGISGIVGTKVSFSGIDVEACGWGAGNVGGSAATGGIKLDSNELMSLISFRDMYFEANEGLGDIIINNTTAAPLIVKISDTVFIRGNARGRGCTNVINVSSTGRGEVILILDACYFFTNPSFGYVPSAAEPIINPHPKLRVYGLDTCVSSQRINVPTDVVGGASVMPLNIAADGSKIMGPAHITASKVGTGIYRLVGSYTYGVNRDSYSVFVTPAVTGFRADAIRSSEILIEIRTYNSAGSLADCAFQAGIVMGAGEGR